MFSLLRMNIYPHFGESLLLFLMFRHFCFAALEQYYSGGWARLDLWANLQQLCLLVRFCYNLMKYCLIAYWLSYSSNLPPSIMVLRVSSQSPFLISLCSSWIVWIMLSSDPNWHCPFLASRSNQSFGSFGPRGWEKTYLAHDYLLGFIILMIAAQISWSSDSWYLHAQCSQDSQWYLIFGHQDQQH